MMINRSRSILSTLSAFLALSGPSGTIITTSAQLCVDDDVALATIASAAGLGNTDCEDSIEFCDFTDDIEGPLVRNVCCETCACRSGTCGAPFCTDVDQQIFSAVAAKFDYDVSDCSDLRRVCNSDKAIGRLARGLCCATCSGGGSPIGFGGDDDEVNETELPPMVDENGRDYPPVHLFLVAGQSECVGGASTRDLERSERYTNLKGVLPGVWFAGYDEYASPERFFIGKMSSSVDRSKFGPELPFGQRLQDANKKNNKPRQQIMMVKYCVGGTNVNTHWNPDSAGNSWNKDQDDGTSQWLEENGGLLWLPVRQSKNYQFKNMAYTIRRTQESLTKAGIPYKWKGIVWLQGTADKSTSETLWKTFGEDTARVLNGFREELGSAVPIVDTGGSRLNQLKSGKEYAMQIVDGCKATSVDIPYGASDDTNTDCIPSPTNPCTGVPGYFNNDEMYEYYGYDPNFTDRPANSKTFQWFVKYPNNLHSGFEGMILKGQMMANEYIRKFTDLSLDYFEDDAAKLFPFDPCPGNSLPNQNNICWIDRREEQLMEGTLCPQLTNSPTREPTASNPVASIPDPSPIIIPTSRPVSVIPAPTPVASPTRNPTSRPVSIIPAPTPVASPTRNPTSRPAIVDFSSDNIATTDSPTAFATSSPTVFGTNTPTEVPASGNTATNPTTIFDLETNGLTGLIFSPEENIQLESSAASMNHALATSFRWGFLLVVSVGIMALADV